MHLGGLHFGGMSPTVPDITQTATQRVSRSGEGHAMGLVVVHHPDPRFLGTTAVLPGRGGMLLGRDCEAFPPGALADARVSRRHCELRRSGQSVLVQDLESRNGTFVNGQAVGEAEIGAGDVLAVGRTLMLLEPLSEQRLSRPHPRLVGQSAALGQALAMIDRVAELDLPVLVLGETGVGKELLCREVHHRSGRQGKALTVNCATLPDELVQSELFGHLRGAFSGADKSRRGLAESAQGGTLILDEIGEASPALQVNLLRLLQEGEVRPVGSDHTSQLDLRFVAATNRPLADAVRTGDFREDLYARLNRCVVRMPPLRERREDILPLARHFAARLAKEPVSLSSELAEAICVCDWPGNARSLQALVERAVIEHQGEAALPLPDWWAEELGHLARADEGTTTSSPPSARARPSQKEVEQCLAKHGGHVTRTAQELGVSRNTLYRWLKTWGLRPEDLR